MIFFLISFRFSLFFQMSASSLFCWAFVHTIQKAGVKLILHGPFAIGSNTKISITPLTFHVIRAKGIQHWIYSRWTMVIGRLSL